MSTKKPDDEGQGTIRKVLREYINLAENYVKNTKGSSTVETVFTTIDKPKKRTLGLTKKKVNVTRQVNIVKLEHEFYNIINVIDMLHASQATTILTPVSSKAAAVNLSEKDIDVKVQAIADLISGGLAIAATTAGIPTGLATISSTLKNVRLTSSTANSRSISLTKVLEPGNEVFRFGVIVIIELSDETSRDILLGKVNKSTATGFIAHKIYDVDVSACNKNYYNDLNDYLLTGYKNKLRENTIKEMESIFSVAAAISKEDR